jgi:hypothetical protein
MEKITQSHLGIQARMLHVDANAEAKKNLMLLNVKVRKQN